LAAFQRPCTTSVRDFPGERGSDSRPSQRIVSPGHGGRVLGLMACRIEARTFLPSRSMTVPVDGGGRVVTVALGPGELARGVPSGGGRAILIIDDEPSFSVGTSLALSRSGRPSRSRLRPCPDALRHYKERKIPIS